MKTTPPAKSATAIIDAMAQKLNLVQMQHHVKERSDGPYLIVDVALPAERLFRALREAQAQVSADNPFRERATVAQREKTSPDRLSLPECQLLKATLSESLTVDRNTFSDDFFGRYIRSVFGYEDQIISAGNHIVYGRRGSGKSSLLAYAMHNCIKQGLPFAWVDMQTYADRNDVQISVDLLGDVVSQLIGFAAKPEELASTRRALESIASMSDHDAEAALAPVIPRLKRALGKLAQAKGTVSLFLDDVHVVRREAQPRLLSRLYSACRGTSCHLKISGIEQFTRPWDSSRNLGLQPPHDAQVLKLDYNLTMPDKSRDHIGNILDAHAKFCGLPDIAYISGKGVLSRLAWVAAAVPRDALNLFSQAITKASAHGQRRVSITSVNAAASDMAEQKLRDMQQDAKGEDAKLQGVLERLKVFCISKKQKNAFLLEIRNDDPTFQGIQELIALRFVHVLHEGITPREAGRRYQALMLDYGFYVGIRAARSVDLFQKEPKTPSAQELRKLPIFSLEDDDANAVAKVGVELGGQATPALGLHEGRGAQAVRPRRRVHPKGRRRIASPRKSA
jgi:hypothetical protein